MPSYSAGEAELVLKVAPRTFGRGRPMPLVMRERTEARRHEGTKARRHGGTKGRAAGAARYAYQAAFCPQSLRRLVA